MIDKKHAGNEISRLIGLNYFPTDARAIRELVTALTFARSEVIATAVINEWLEGASDRPTPADLRRMVAAHNGIAEEQNNRETETAPVHYNCRTCHDEGFYGGQLAGRFAGPWKWCDCSAGYRAREHNAELVEEANIKRDRLMKTFPDKPAMAALGPAVDGYHGDF